MTPGRIGPVIGEEQSINSSWRRLIKCQRICFNSIAGNQAHTRKRRYHKHTKSKKVMNIGMIAYNQTPQNRQKTNSQIQHPLHITQSFFWTMSEKMNADNQKISGSDDRHRIFIIIRLAPERTKKRERNSAIIMC